MVQSPRSLATGVMRRRGSAGPAPGSVLTTLVFQPPPRVDPTDVSPQRPASCMMAGTSARSLHCPRTHSRACQSCSSGSSTGRKRYRGFVVGTGHRGVFSQAGRECGIARPRLSSPPCFRAGEALRRRTSILRSDGCRTSQAMRRSRRLLCSG